MTLELERSRKAEIARLKADLNMDPALRTRFSGATLSSAEEAVSFLQSSGYQISASDLTADVPARPVPLDDKALDAVAGGFFGYPAGLIGQLVR
ncbi:hypothetical protein GCM10007301_27210 [Azorhizobium oxalatiphilum]|uniref:Nif11 domain-containing protein n=2 Tax=Azorhizobium oxalatiphilum TaxID=980631 RepID=A0A917FDW5_9HYPH|nr:hypothetical protein GCM10007301_27210 [Azorhizobium oxalatiphilum]